jgi:hypothetical protein
MANSGENLSILFRSLGSDDQRFHVAENELAKKSEQRWPLFKAVSLTRPEPTPELSAQERQRWSRQEKSVVEARKPALSLPAFNEKLTISLDKIAKQVELGAGQSSVRSEQPRGPSESLVGHRDEPNQLTSNNVNPANITPTPQFFTPPAPVVALNLEVEPRSFEHTDVQPAVPMRDLSVMDHADDSLQSLFSRIQGKEKVTVKPVEKRSSFFDRLKKR